MTASLWQHRPWIIAGCIVVIVVCALVAHRWAEREAEEARLRRKLSSVRFRAEREGW